MDRDNVQFETAGRPLRLPPYRRLRVQAALVLVAVLAVVGWVYFQGQPVSAEAFFNRGTGYAAAGDYARAIADYDQAIQRNARGGHNAGSQPFKWRLQQLPCSCQYDRHG